MRHRVELSAATAQLPLPEGAKPERMRLVLVAQQPGQGEVIGLTWKPVPRPE